MMIPFESAVRGSLERSRGDRAHVHRTRRPLVALHHYQGRNLPEAFGSGTRTQQTSSALPMSRAAIRSTTCSLSCVCSSIPTPTLDALSAGHPWELQGNGESSSRARGNKEGPNGAAPGARLFNDLEDQATTTSTGSRTPFSARNGPPDRAIGDYSLGFQISRSFMGKGAPDAMKELRVGPRSG